MLSTPQCPHDALFTKGKLLTEKNIGTIFFFGGGALESDIAGKTDYFSYSQFPDLMYVPYPKLIANSCTGGNFPSS